MISGLDMYRIHKRHSGEGWGIGGETEHPSARPTIIPALRPTWEKLTVAAVGG